MIETAIQFSGGKDSLACLYLYREQWNEILVCWVNTGAPYPETVERMREWQSRVPHFLEIKSEQPAQIEKNGYPCDVVPLSYTPMGRGHVKSAGDFRLQSYFQCCAENIWIPMQLEMKKRGITKIIRGQRKDERRTNGTSSGYVEDGIEYIFPLEDWSEQQVFDYLRLVGAEIPEHYAREKTSRDCWDCTAFLDENVERIRNLPDDRRHEVLRRLAVINSAISIEMAPLEEALHACG